MCWYGFSNQSAAALCSAHTSCGSVVSLLSVQECHSVEFHLESVLGESPERWLDDGLADDVGWSCIIF